MKPQPNQKQLRNTSFKNPLGGASSLPGVPAASGASSAGPPAAEASRQPQCAGSHSQGAHTLCSAQNRCSCDCRTPGHPSTLCCRSTCYSSAAAGLCHPPRQAPPPASGPEGAAPAPSTGAPPAGRPGLQAAEEAAALHP